MAAPGKEIFKNRRAAAVIRSGRMRSNRHRAQGYVFEDRSRRRYPRQFIKPVSEVSETRCVAGFGRYELSILSFARVRIVSRSRLG